MSSKRGRPKKNRFNMEVDHGTAQLQKKRSVGITSESIDLCLKYNFITQAQHKNAIRFRWLHTLRFGVSTIKSYDPLKLDIGGSSYIALEDDIWLQERTEEYRDLVSALIRVDALEIVQQIVIYHYYPFFLLQAQNKISAANSIPELPPTNTELYKISNNPTTAISDGAENFYIAPGHYKAKNLHCGKTVYSKTKITNLLHKPILESPKEQIKEKNIVWNMHSIQELQNFNLGIRELEYYYKQKNTLH